eukprot:5254182-Prymnesium_polylepis.1
MSSASRGLKINFSTEYAGHPPTKPRPQRTDTTSVKRHYSVGIYAAVRLCSVAFTRTTLSRSREIALPV